MAKKKTNNIFVCTRETSQWICVGLSIFIFLVTQHDTFASPNHLTITTRSFPLILKLQTSNILYLLYPLIESHSGVSFVLNQEVAGNCTALKVLMKIELCICHISLYFSDLRYTSGNTTPCWLKSLSLFWSTVVSTFCYFLVPLDWFAAVKSENNNGGKAKTPLNAHINAVASVLLLTTAGVCGSPPVTASLPVVARCLHVISSQWWSSASRGQNFTIRRHHYVTTLSPAELQLCYENVCPLSSKSKAEIGELAQDRIEYWGFFLSYMFPKW